MAVAYTSRGVMGDRSTAAGCLAMIYTVYKGVGCGMGAVEADFHYAAQIIRNNITCLRNTTLNTVQFERCWKRVKSICVWFPTSLVKLTNELNGSRRSFLCVPSTRLKTRLVESGSRRSAYDFRPQPPNWRSNSMRQDVLCSLMGLPYETLYQSSTYLQQPKLEWGRLDRPHQERCPQFWGDVDGAQKCAPCFNSVLSPQVEMCLTDLMTGIKVRS